MNDWTFEEWPIMGGFIPTNWNSEGKPTGGAWYGAAYTHCVRASCGERPHVSLFGVGLTADEARADVEKKIRERRGE